MIAKNRRPLQEIFSSENFRARRALFTYLIIAYCLFAITGLALFVSGEVAKTAVQAFETVTLISLMSYLGISAVDRAGILERFSNQSSKTPPPKA